MAEWRVPCNGCGRHDLDLWRCTRCFRVYYCSGKCQKTDWVNHKLQCSKRDGTKDTPKKSRRKSKNSSRSDKTISGADASTMDTAANEVCTNFSDVAISEEAQDGNCETKTDELTDNDIIQSRSNAECGNHESETGRTNIELFDTEDDTVTSENFNKHSNNSDSKGTCQITDGRAIQFEYGYELVNNCVIDESIDRAAADYAEETTNDGRFSSPEGKFGQQERKNEFGDIATASMDALPGKASTEHEVHVSSSNIADTEIVETSSKNDKSGPADSQPKGKCSGCSKADCTRRCVKCRTAFYCSRPCQARDWPVHKQSCRKHRPESHVSPVSGSGTGNATVDMMTMGFLPPVVTDREAIAPAGALQKAKNYAKWKISPTWTSHLKIVDDLCEVPWGNGLVCPSDSTKQQSIGLVAFIFKYHPYMKWHGVYIKDKKDYVTKVEFFLENDDPLGFFGFTNVKPGNYICLERPFMEAFTDGTVGIRVYDPSQVSIILSDRL